jgi:multidrug transporter EmrE-like cation transporter
MKNILLVLMSVGPAVVGQLLLKSAIRDVGVSIDVVGLLAYFTRVLTTPRVLFAFMLYGASSLVWIVVLSKLELSLAYPLVSIGYVLVVFLSWMILKEPVSAVRIAGLMIICVGVIVISRS